MIPALVAASMAILPYAPSDLIFQSDDAVKTACMQFETSANTDLNQFVQCSQKGDYTTAYQIWSDLLFRYVSFKANLGQTRELSLSATVKDSVTTQGNLLKKTFQQQLTSHPDLLNTFLKNADASAKLTPQQRLFTVNILKEYQETHPKEKSRIAQALQKLAMEKTESFCRARGLATPVNPAALSSLKVFTANIICFPGVLPYMFGGISPWKERIDRLVETIRTADAHFVCLQEVWDPEAMRALAARLKDSYSFFIYDAGDPAGTLQEEKMGYNSGLFIASKLPLDAVAFERFPRSIPEMSNRGALIATALVAQKHFSLINTHLQHGDTPEMQEVRKEQLSVCHKTLQSILSRAPGHAWGCLAGDLNVDAFTPEFQASGLFQLFIIPYTAQLSEAQPTSTNYFNKIVLTAPDKRAEVPITYELLDYCIRPASSDVVVHSKQELIPLYQITEPTAALSDHQALLTTWTVPPTLP